MKRGVFTLLILALIAFPSCKKSELKKPADVSVKMDINRLPSNQGHLEFNSGYIRLANFSVEGTRQEGGPVALSKQFPGGLLVNFSPNDAVTELYLDIPQGNYTTLAISFDTSEGKDEPTIRVSGTYTNLASQQIPVVFEFLSSESFAIEGESETNDPVIVLDKNIPSTTFIKLDPIYWFDIVSTNQWENATLSDVGGIMTILIKDGSNSNIYDIMVDRIDDTAEGILSN